jgi:Protease inhibitor Inh
MRCSVSRASLRGMIATVVMALAGGVGAQTPPELSETVKAMIGTWEMSNSDRDRSCTLTFRLDPAAVGYSVDVEKACADQFPALRDVAAWSFGKNDTLLLLDKRRAPILEMLEVEVGMFEGLRPNEGRYFLQNAAVAAATRDKTPDQMFGTWAFTGGTGKPICTVTLGDTAADADSFALKLAPGCDQLITRFGPAAWKMDRGQLVVLSGKGQIWRFEESDSTTWRRIPEGRQPLLLARQ